MRYPLLTLFLSLFFVFPASAADSPAATGHIEVNGVRFDVVDFNFLTKKDDGKRQTDLFPFALTPEEKAKAVNNEAVSALINAHQAVSTKITPYVSIAITPPKEGRPGDFDMLTLCTHHIEKDGSNVCVSNDGDAFKQGTWKKTEDGRIAWSGTYTIYGGTIITWDVAFPVSE